MGATTPNEKSLLYFCLNAGNPTLREQALQVQQQLTTALEKVAAMKRPFALYYTDASVETAITALDNLDAALAAMEETLQTYAGNATVEAQCKIINANYVDNVVVRLYTSLCDNAEKLYQAIVKIKD